MTAGKKTKSQRRERQAMKNPNKTKTTASGLKVRTSVRAGARVDYFLKIP
jgi:hypothetical protein